MLEAVVDSGELVRARYVQQTASAVTGQLDGTAADLRQRRAFPRRRQPKPALGSAQNTWLCM